MTTVVNVSQEKTEMLLNHTHNYGCGCEYRYMDSTYLELKKLHVNRAVEAYCQNSGDY